MRFPQFTEQEFTIDGSWQDDERQLRFTSTISSSARFVILSLLKYGDEYHYMRHNKSVASEVPLELFQSKFPHQNRYQHTLSIGYSVNTGAISEGRLFLPADLPMIFQTGQLFTFATDARNQPFIHLVAIAKTDIKSKRCGIWAVKPRLLDGLKEPWLNVLSRTRQVVIRFGRRALL